MQLRHRSIRRQVPTRSVGTTTIIMTTTEKCPMLPLPLREGEIPSAASLLGLLAWLSPGVPTGVYAYSHGLE